MAWNIPVPDYIRRAIEEAQQHQQVAKQATKWHSEAAAYYYMKATPRPKLPKPSPNAAMLSRDFVDRPPNSTELELIQLFSHWSVERLQAYQSPKQPEFLKRGLWRQDAKGQWHRVRVAGRQV